MTIVFRPSFARGSVQLPFSKSQTHRVLILSSMLPAESRWEAPADSEDLQATVRCLKTLGADIREENGGLRIRGRHPSEFCAKAPLDCGESASTLRFLLPVTLLSGQRTVWVRGRSLSARPVRDFSSFCRENGWFFAESGDSVEAQGSMKAGAYTLPGNITSQWASGCLMSFPFLEGVSTLTLGSGTESRPYLELTEKTLRSFGADIRREGNVYTVRGGQPLHAWEGVPERDASSAAVFAAMNHLGSCVSYGEASFASQGDRVFETCLARLEEKQAELSLADCPDLGPVLMAVAAARNGAVFTHCGRLRFKESDRVESMRRELAKFGIRLEWREDQICEVLPGVLRKPEVALDAHRDHRVAMALSVLLMKTGGTMTGCECVSKSYPSFFRDLRLLGVEAENQSEE